VRFFEQAHIKDVVSYLRVIVNPRDELAWKRILKMIPGIGGTTANRVFEEIASRHKAEPPALAGGEASTAITTFEVTQTLTTDVLNSVPRLRSSQPFRDFIVLLEYLASAENRNNPSRQISIILERGYEAYLQENYENAESRAEDIRGLALYAQRYDSTDTFLSELALLSTESFREPQPVVGEEVISGGDEDELLTLTSVHQAKGLEWKAVFMIWAAEGKFPSPRSLKEIDSEEEERRLWYVSLTRAKDELYITYPLMMTDYNRQTVLQKPSRFVTECPPDMFEIWNLEEESAPWQDPAFHLSEGEEFIN
jgi:DNA helicase-2/ATP-dependent DNA helicase PcrA